MTLKSAGDRVIYKISMKRCKSIDDYAKDGGPEVV